MTLATIHVFRHLPDHAAAIHDGGLLWLKANRATVLSWAAQHGITLAVERALAVDLDGFSTGRTIAPVSGPFAQKGWTGPHVRKPWDYAVTVVIPVIDSPESVTAIVDILRLQTLRPFIMLIDTGSSPENLAAIQKLEAADVEVHSLRFSGVNHPSDFPAIAMDLAFSACRTRFVIATHADCFLTGRDVLNEIVELLKSHCVVGYELTERPHSDWRGMVGHTLTGFDIHVMDKINAGWSLRRLIAQFPHPDGMPALHNISPATSPNWPDTELLLNYQLRQNGIQPLIIGKERNAARTTDHRIDHCRSVASATLYSAGSEYHNNATGWLQDGIRKAKERVRRWTASNQNRKATS